MRRLVLCVRFERFLGVLWELPTAQQTSIYRTDERKMAFGSALLKF